MDSKPIGRDEQERREQIDMILKELTCHMDELSALCSDAADLALDTNVPHVASVKPAASAAPAAPYDSPTGEEAVN